jgi:serine phosphatase RsbU (regulator of sigma subunit)/anti-sigma regulatory factor (Ser/Thr protein kinase)/anti-anti-sigma regulatory factor
VGSQEAAVPGSAHDDDKLGQLTGDAAVVRDVFEQMPMVLMALDGPDHRLAAMNAAYRAFTGRAGVIGVTYRDAFPELAGQQVYELFDRVYATGEAETGTEWRAQVDLGPQGMREVFADFTVAPRRAADGSVSGLLIMATDVTSRVMEQRAAQRRAAEAERRNPASRGIVAELQEALLPTALPVLPRARIAARYLVAGLEQAAGGDWFDAIPLDGGGVALVVGDVVGHGVAASAAMGQLRAVLAELLAAEKDLGQVLRRSDAFAARMPSLRAATLALAVLDPATGTLRYTTCGHPPPLVLGVDGTSRYLAGTGTGPLGTGSTPMLASSVLAPGELVLLYSDGLVERPNRTIAEGMAELAAVAADAAANRSLTLDADPATAERVCQLTVELLTRTGHNDDITALAAQRLADPVPALHLSLPSERPSLTTARDAFAGWLSRLDAAADDWEALHLAMVEVFTNAIEYAYPRDEPGTIELDATLENDGSVACLVTDHGTWRTPGPDDADRGHGLMVAGNVVDKLLVSHPGPNGTAASQGTTVILRHRLRRPAVLAPGHHGEPAAQPAQPQFTVDTSVTARAPGGAPADAPASAPADAPASATAGAAAGATARALVGGPVDITTADLLARRLLSVSRGGTVPLVADLTGVTQLASAGVRALYQVSEQLAAHGQELTLVAAAGSAAHLVLDLVRLDHVTGEAGA